jgi:hypothetical protein
VDSGYAANTSRTYSSAQKRYIKYCQKHGINPCPASEQTLLRYIAYLYNDGVKLARTISVYLAAVRALHIKVGLPEPPNRGPRILLALKGLEREGSPPAQKLPITYQLLTRFLLCMGDSFNDCMLWAAASAAFFGCFRADEFTVDLSLPDSIKVLRVQDFNWFPLHVPPYVVVSLKRTKTQIHGDKVVIGCSGTKVSGYCALSKYLQLRFGKNIAITNPAALVYESGNVLDHVSFSQFTKATVKKLGLDPARYSAHSYRSGAATSAGSNHFGDWEVQRLGRWRSQAYKTYIRQPDSHSATFAARLAGKP